MRLKRCIYILMVGWMLWSAAWPAIADPPPASEYQIKAAFLYNFAKFIEWPANAHVAEAQAFTIGILGQDPFGPDIAVIEGKPVKGKPLRVLHALTLEELKGCQVIFISAASAVELERILNNLKGKPVLTVGETEGFAYHGGMINLLTVENKVRFEINTRMAEQAGLKISSHLLRLAKIVSAEDTNESNKDAISKPVN
ncbi:MAG: YfiR family protein [Desulfobacterales bacterium]|nr:YfiR family protein [Desulfobacterales bacterium]